MLVESNEDLIRVLSVSHFRLWVIHAYYSLSIIIITILNEAYLFRLMRFVHYLLTLSSIIIVTI
jgi:hypothetical protein